MFIPKRLATNITLAALFSASALAFSGEVLSASLFDSGIPAGWASVGNTGTLGANGVVTLAPGGGSQYGYVSTAGGVTGVGLGLGSETNGSTLTSSLFSATAGSDLKFSFNFVTSDGAGYADYGWAQLLDSSSAPVATLFTARTTPSGNSVPGFGMPAIAATMTPSTVTIIAGGPDWAPLAGSSNGCYSTGCGYSGWIQSNYTIAANGDYRLKFGVVNWSDQAWHTGMAFDGITVGGVPISQIPEPSTYGMMLAGLGLIGFISYRRKEDSSNMPMAA